MGRSLLSLLEVYAFAARRYASKAAGIARPAEFDFGREIAQERDFQSAGHLCGNLGLKFEHIAQVPVIGLDHR